MAEAAALEEYFVSDACIACDACCNDFPDIFIMNTEHTRAKAVAPTPHGKFNPWDIITVCPVDAISLIKGELPPRPEGQAEAAVEAKAEPGAVVDTRPWQERWAEVKDRAESEWERMKRYGMAFTIEETVDKIYVRFALPKEVPNHPLKFQWNLPNTMPDYKVEVKVDGKWLKIHGKLEDKAVIRLTGVINSFPDRFLREIELPVACTEFTQSYNKAEKLLDITIDKPVKVQAA